MTNFPKVILAIYPNARGYGYAIIQGNHPPIDCGIRNITSASRNVLLQEIERNINFYEPDIIILRDHTSDRYLKKKTKKIIEQIIKTCKQRKLAVFQYSREDIKFVFAQFDAVTKYEIVSKIIEWFPSLKNSMTRKRKLGEPEEYKMGMFDAVSLIATHQYLN